MPIVEKIDKVERIVVYGKDIGILGERQKVLKSTTGSYIPIIRASNIKEIEHDLTSGKNRMFIQFDKPVGCRWWRPAKKGQGTSFLACGEGKLKELKIIGD